MAITQNTKNESNEYQIGIKDLLGQIAKAKKGASFADEGYILQLRAIAQKYDLMVQRRKDRIALHGRSFYDEQELERLQTESRNAHKKLKEEEHVRSATCMDLPLDFINSFADDERAQKSADSISDGLIMSLNELGKVDIEYIASVCGTEPKDVIAELRGSIYQNPAKWNDCFYKGWETSDEYLSGNLAEKLKLAREANERFHGYFDDNVKALERVMPEVVEQGDIYVTLGSPWIPTDIIDEFIEYLMGYQFGYYHNSFSESVRRDPLTGIWEIPKKGRAKWNYCHGPIGKFSTTRISAMNTIKKREETLKKIAIGGYDACIMAYSCFDLLPLSREYYEREYKERLEELKKVEYVFYSINPVGRKIKAIENALDKLAVSAKSLRSECTFDQLGITTLFVDEAHNYKNVPIESHLESVNGLNLKGSDKCKWMMDKVRCVQRNNGGRGVVFATGTPITNSVTDIYVMQQYLQSGELKMLDILNFDSWAGMFAEKSTQYEIDVDTSGYHMVTRFNRFHNIPELTAILSSIADFHEADIGNGIPEFNGYTDVVIPASTEFKRYISKISRRADDVRRGRVKREEDNLLKITTDGRKAALDLRLIDPELPEKEGRKVRACAERVLEVYKETENFKGTQLVFCDSSVPKDDFNMYDELKRLLTGKGIPENEIAFIHSADTEEKRSELFAKVCRGEVRVLIGSTFKLGLGVNVQERLAALHHLDEPYRPSDLTQREGRALRQGNTCQEVQIFRYVVTGSFDAYSWQLLEQKQRFITQLLSGEATERSGDEVDGTVLSYAEVKALAMGNSRIKDRCEAANELSRLKLLQRGYIASREKMNKDLMAIPAKLASAMVTLENAEKDKERYAKSRYEIASDEAKMVREKIASALRMGVGRPEETEVMNYQGFRVIIPRFMRPESPKVILSGFGSYDIEMGSEKGITIRLNNFLEGFDSYIEDCKANVERIKARESSLRFQLAEEGGYEAEIEKAEEALQLIDKELGITHEC